MLGGDQFTAADAAATMHLPLVRTIATTALGADPLAGVPGLDDYLARMEQRPTVQRIRADQRADQPAFYAHIQKQLTGGL